MRGNDLGRLFSLFNPLLDHLHFVEWRHTAVRTRPRGEQGLGQSWRFDGHRGISLREGQLVTKREKNCGGTRGQQERASIHCLRNIDADASILHRFPSTTQVSQLSQDYCTTIVPLIMFIPQ